MNHSSALGYSPQLPVSVYGTGRFTRYFLEVASVHYQITPKGSLYYRSVLPNLQRTIPSVRDTYTTPSLSL
jgi:hypothetical protein